MFDKILMSKAKEIADLENEKGANIQSIQAFRKGQIVFFKTVKKDTIIFTNYFGDNWIEGIQLIFEVVDNKLKFIKFGSLREDNSSKNSEVLNKLISNIENYTLSF